MHVWTSLKAIYKYNWVTPRYRGRLGKLLVVQLFTETKCNCNIYNRPTFVPKFFVSPYPAQKLAIGWAHNVCSTLYFLQYVQLSMLNSYTEDGRNGLLRNVGTYMRSGWQYSSLWECSTSHTSRSNCCTTGCCNKTRSRQHRPERRQQYGLCRRLNVAAGSQIRNRKNTDVT
jgi:hypothetical protein